MVSFSSGRLYLGLDVVFVLHLPLIGQIHLDKKVPTGAGLGGGSSNAATALWAANQFSGCLATEKELQEWSSEIGSDVPFFFSHGAAYCTGRGEVCLKSKLSRSKCSSNLSALLPSLTSM